MRRLIPYQSIAEAIDGDSDAMAYILHHYDDYINYYSIREGTTKHGKQRIDANEDVRQYIITKLIIAIVRNFDHTKLPVGETLDY
jgi:hypothetical protein